MLIRKLANSDTTEQIHADTEVFFTADSGFSTVIPLGKNWKTLGIQVSGGLDSALLLFLTAKAIQDQNLNIKIQPISIFIPTKAKNIVATKAIIEKVRELTGADFINDGLVFNMPLELTSTKDGKKDKFFDTTIVQLFNDGIIDFEFNGNTKNPPEHIRKYFDNDNSRQKNRDNAESIYNNPWGASPHYNMDKRDIVNLYVKYDLVNELAPLTISCDANTNMIHSKQSTVPCGQCWWCHERKYGFDSNNVIDPAPILTYKEYLSIPEKKLTE